MIFKNNQISMDTDAEHLARARMMADGIAVYAAELDIPSDVADEYAVYADEFYNALNTQHEESADVDEFFVIVKNAHENTIAKFRACQSIIMGEMQFASDSTKEYLDERFEIYDDIPRDRKGFVKIAEFLVSAYDAIGVEHPDVDLPETPFEELRTAVANLNTSMKALGKEKAEQFSATVSKNVLRKNTGEKLMRKCLHRVNAYWGDNDPRMLELGLVPKSSIWTPGQPEPGEPEFPPWPGPVEIFTLEFLGEGEVEIVYSGVKEATIGWLHRRKVNTEDWILVADDLPMNPEDILPFRERHVPVGTWEYRFIPMRGVEKGVASFATVEVTE